MIKFGEPSFYKGMITIKVKEGFGNIPTQRGTVEFNNPEMDKLVDKFAINTVENRFRHRPILKNSKLPDLSRIYRITFPEEYSIVEIVTEFSKLKEIEYAEPIPLSFLCEEPNDPFYSLQQHLPQIMAEEAWNIHHGDEGTEEIVIAINDTGVDWGHPDLVDNIWQNLGEDADGDGHVLEYISGEWVFDPGDENGIDDDGNGYVDDFIGWDFQMDDNDPYPNPGAQSLDHGTHCAGIAAARTNNGTGIASVSWNVSIFSTQVDDGSWMTWGYDGIIYAAENGADIISNSWVHPYSQANEEVIAYATGLGSIVVAAAGNGAYSTFAEYPGGYPGVISVASVSEDDTKASYSNWGRWVDVSAPGGGSEGGIYSTILNGEYGFKSGTSMATPLVAGLLGLVKSYHPGWNNDEIILQVIGTADDIDNLNPGYENQMGSGRINAYRALSESNVSGPEELRLEYISTTINDENGNEILEQGEIVNIDLIMWNRAPASRSFNTTFTITTDDPEITMLQDVIVDSVPFDAYFIIENAFQIQIDQNATSHIASFTLDISSDITITYGEQFSFYLPIMADGILVWEGKENGDSYSGVYICDFLEIQGIGHVYSTGYPETFTGYDQVFLSFGNWGSASGYTLITKNMIDVIVKYAAGGGKIYIEDSGIFDYFDRHNLFLYGLFGIGQAWDGTDDANPVSHLEGGINSIAEGMDFFESLQENNIYIGSYATSGSGQSVFIQDEDTVAVQNAGDSLQRTFCFYYSLAELVDNSAENSRFNLLYKILDFFEYEFPEEFVIANFIADTTFGSPPLQVSFEDWSLHDSLVEITEYEWDFDNDGVIDSYDQHPTWIYNEPGQYTVSLTACTEQDTNSFTVEKYIWVNEGILVYEGVEDGQDYSGTFIRDYFENKGLDVDYTTDFPPGLAGYNAVFLSYGNAGSGKTRLDPAMSKQIVNYIETGGYVYLEGGDCLNDGKTNNSFLSLFSVIVSHDGVLNIIDGLEGQADAITHDMYFTGSNQSANEKIDRIFSGPTGINAFNEIDYFNVAAQGEGAYGQRTFCFSYALAELIDEDPPSTRNDLLERISIFFDLLVGDTELIKGQTGLNTYTYPNPCSQTVQLRYQLDDKENVVADLYHISGKYINRLQEERKIPGTYEMRIDLTDLPAGVYLIRVQAGETVEFEKIVKVE